MSRKDATEDAKPCASPSALAVDVTARSKSTGAFPLILAFVCGLKAGPRLGFGRRRVKARHPGLIDTFSVTRRPAFRIPSKMNSHSNDRSAG
jgi:hypothetical protein